jgi:hypothetical protein
MRVPSPAQGEAVKRKRSLNWEEAFHFIWQNAGRDGIWQGDAASLAEKVDALENDAESILDELRDRRLIAKLDARTSFLSKWRERDERGTP